MEDPLTVPNSLTKEQASSFFDGLFFAYLMFSLTVTKRLPLVPLYHSFPCLSSIFGETSVFSNAVCAPALLSKQPRGMAGVGEGEGVWYHHLHLLSHQPPPRPI